MLCVAGGIGVVMSKKGAKKAAAPPVKKGAQPKEEEDDWEKALDDFKAEVGIPDKPPTPPPAEAVPPVSPKAAGGDDDDDDDDEEEGGEGGGAGKKDDKKKKKKKKDKKAGEEKKGAKQSALGSVIAARLKAQQEEEERMKKLMEEEEAKRLEEERRIEEEIRQKEEEKRIKKEKQRAKLEKMKAEGTYMTKAQKEKQARARAALEQMRAAGLVQIPADEVSGPGGEAGKKPTYGKGKKGKKEGGQAAKPTATNGDQAHEDEPRDEPAPQQEEPAQEGGAAAEPAAPVVDRDWDDEEWDAAAEDTLAARISQVTLTSHRPGGSYTVFGEADEIDEDAVKEQERLRQLGIARLKREEEERIRQEAMRREQDERDRAEREMEMKKEEARKRRLAREEEAEKKRSMDKLRSPICCIMGHVDTGKTKLLDNIRRTNVQEGEAGGITQQIGATFFPKDTLLTRTAALNQGEMKIDVILPGLLIIDTPGHESFSNLRSRGSMLCDIAILVIDLMHGLEPQTIESINMLRKKRTPFVVALNKVDRCYNWKVTTNSPFRPALELQSEDTRREFYDRTDHVIMQLKEKGLNSELYWRNTDVAHTVSLIPTSAITGEGISDLLLLLVKLTQTRMAKSLMYNESVQCTVLEVKQLEGLGTTVDVILVNGTLKEGDTIVVCTLEGPVVTTIRALLTPPPSREMRVGHQFIHHPQIEAAMGIKIVANGLEKAVAGTGIMVVGPDDDENDIKEEVMRDITKVMGSIETEARGVTVHASTLGALEALLEYLRKELNPPVPVAKASIGPIFKRDVTQTAINIEKGRPEYAVILAFDVKIDGEAQAHANESKVRIFTADIIYHLGDAFVAHMRTITEQRKAEAMEKAVFPCILKVMPQHIFNMKDPIVLGVEVTHGTLRVGTPLCVPGRGGLEIGKVVSIQSNHKELDRLAKASTAAIKIEHTHNPSITYGRHFDHTSALYSKLTRDSIDALKEHFKTDVPQEDWRLVVQIMKVLGIPLKAAASAPPPPRKEAAATAPDHGMDDDDDDDDDEEDEES